MVRHEDGVINKIDGKCDWGVGEIRINSHGTKESDSSREG